MLFWQNPLFLTNWILNKTYFITRVKFSLIENFVKITTFWYFGPRQNNNKPIARVQKILVWQTGILCPFLLLFWQNKNCLCICFQNVVFMTSPLLYLFIPFSFCNKFSILTKFVSGHPVETILLCWVIVSLEESVQVLMITWEWYRSDSA